MLSSQHHSTFYQKWSRAFCQRTPPGVPPHPATLSAVQKKIKHDLFYSHVLAVSSFSTLIRSASFRCTPFRYTTSFRSFHSPQHRTAKAIPSLHSANQSHRLSVSWRPDSPSTEPSHNRDCSCHSKPPTRFAPFRSVIAFALHPPHDWKRYALFFLRSVYPSQHTKGKSFLIE